MPKKRRVNSGVPRPRRAVTAAERPARAKVPEELRAPAKGAGTRPARGKAAGERRPRAKGAVRPYQITLRTPDRTVAFTPGKSLPARAMQWSYRLRNRARWKDSPDARRGLEESCLESLTALGLTREALSAIVQAPLIEIGIPWSRENEGWEARIFPWEFVLSAATRRLGRTGKQSIIRLLEREGAGRGRAALDRRGPSALFVECAPGVLRDLYDFSAEREMVKAALSPRSWEVAVDPDPEALRAQIRTQSPDVVHLAGFDIHQGVSLLRAYDERAVPEVTEPFRRDGYLMAHGRRPVPVSAGELAGILGAGRTPPRLVGCNLYESAARIAPLLVAKGIEGAVGFDFLQDDALMELFFARFYRGWRISGGDPLTGFMAGWKTLGDQPRNIKGTSVTLWSGVSLTGRTRSAGVHLTQMAVEDSTRLVPPPANRPLEDLVRLDVEPVSEINYSLLHNHRSLFEKFLIHKYRPGVMAGVEVNVALNLGAESFAYRTVIDVSVSPRDLARDVRIPLVWSIARMLREPVRTTLLVDASWSGRTLMRDTLEVTLLPVSDWRDSPVDNAWLPSFVLPRDPAVLRIVDAAQRYLIAMDDDPTAGYDGYQTFWAGDRPGGLRHVDRQVQSLWYALLYDYPLGYINPPPPSTPESQRLRSPSEVLNGKRGTCIDLALMLASCLEFVDIHPVVFLLTDHAFPGYWRDPDAYDQFTSMREAGVRERVLVEGEQGQCEAWYLGRDNLDEILAHVRSGALVPLETVDLTTHASLAEAHSDGRANLRAQSRFDSMLDVTLARANGVTPLPFIEEPTLEER